MAAELASKTCAACGRDFSWRRKWARSWAQVRYCSERCRRQRVGPSRLLQGDRPGRRSERTVREQSNFVRVPRAADRREHPCGHPARRPHRRCAREADRDSARVVGVGGAAAAGRHARGVNPRPTPRTAFGRRGDRHIQDSIVDPRSSIRIPYGLEQGTFLNEQGIHGIETGNRSSLLSHRRVSGETASRD